MRLLSFFNQVETTLAMLKPECASGWKRRADYLTGSATCWHEQTGLALSLHTSELGGGRFSVHSTWSAQNGLALYDRTFFCGPSTFDWQSSADAVAEAMPDAPPASISTPNFNETESAPLKRAASA